VKRSRPHLLRRRLACLRRQRGAVALEAMISIIFMFAAIYAMWGVALIIFNQTKLVTATQLSSQAALITYDRSTYRGRDVAGLYAKANARASEVAKSVFRENTCGMLPDQFSGEAPLDICHDSPGEAVPNFSVSIRCSPTLTNTPWRPCNTGGETAMALRVTVASQATSPFFFLTPFRGTGFGGGDPEEHLARMKASSSTYGYAASLPADGTGG
jgi:hypothetical protein